MKKGFRNYNFEFDKNEIRMLTSLCKQVMKQVEGKREYYAIERAFSGTLEKLSSGEDVIRLTKDEYIQISLHLRENVKFFAEKIKTSWFFMKWFYKPLMKNYQTIYETHFKD